ncbi:hypothetical protein NP493_291g02019 [Ridgeia piscesae]|uniref:Uncharacterized protein n=1 Tax=Ridgeia piscesae TaxID=27915 RepID=A0AAD9UC20_RIDPI|nr:hypothetical protein NP493_291g02019 [Ridgeia piscesae]
MLEPYMTEEFIHSAFSAMNETVVGVKMIWNSYPTPPIEVITDTPRWSNLKVSSTLAVRDRWSWGGCDHVLLRVSTTIWDRRPGDAFTSASGDRQCRVDYHLSTLISVGCRHRRQ